MPDDRILGVFAKKPLAGAVKTRLASATSPEFAAAAAQAFLLDTLDRCRVLPAEKFLVHAPAEESPWFARVAGSDYRTQAQSPGDLGRRMADFLTGKPERGRVVVVGTDSPTLPLHLFEQAWEALEETDVAIVPAFDGGYCLLGCARRLPPIFDNMPWSTEAVLHETVRRLKADGFSLALLPPWYDVDTLADWSFLKGHLEAMRLAGVDPLVPRTEILLRESRPPQG